MNDFERKLWEERASLGGIRSTMDPADVKGLKNSYIDLSHKTCLSREMDFSPEDKVLDFGCGFGRLSAWIADFGVSEVIGLDASPEMVEGASRQCLPRGNLSFLNYEGARIPFSDGYFDKVLSVWVLQHIVERGKFQAAIQGLSRVLRSGGRIFLIEHVMKETTLEKYPGTNLHYKILRAPEEYIGSFQQENFKLVKHCAISARRGGLFYKFIDRNLFPTFMKPLLRPLVQFDLLWTRGNGIPSEGYIDCLFIFEKVDKR